MKQSIILVIGFLLCIQTTFSQIKVGRNQSFDSNWKFKKGSGIDAKANNFNDTDWRKLDVPHDWSIEDLTDTPNDSTIGLSSLGPFYKNNAGKTPQLLRLAVLLGIVKLLRWTKAPLAKKYSFSLMAFT